MTRREAREQAFILVFEKIFNPELSLDEMKNIAEDEELFVLDEFAENIVKAVFDNIEAIDKEITLYLRNWTIDRIPKVDLAVLRLAAGEILYIDDIPDKVAANEAVELTKKYSGEERAKFINGVLGNLIRAKNG